jgi:hypothetical protein
VSRRVSFRPEPADELVARIRDAEIVIRFGSTSKFTVDVF